MRTLAEKLFLRMSVIGEDPDTTATRALRFAEAFEEALAKRQKSAWESNYSAMTAKMSSAAAPPPDKTPISAPPVSDMERALFLGETSALKTERDRVGELLDWQDRESVIVAAERVVVELTAKTRQEERLVELVQGRGSSLLDGMKEWVDECLRLRKEASAQNAAFERVVAERDKAWKDLAARCAESEATAQALLDARSRFAALHSAISALPGYSRELGSAEEDYIKRADAVAAVMEKMP